MSKVTSVNAGSSSLRFQLFEVPNEGVLTSGVVKKIGFGDIIFTIEVNGEKIKKVLPIPDHAKTANMLLEVLAEHKTINNPDEITDAGHHAVHGGEIFKESVPVAEDVVEEFASLNDLAPLYSPAGPVGYNAFKNNPLSYKHVFVFDTAFHSMMSKESYVYALPMKYYDEYKIRRHGPYGISHEHVSLRCAELMNKKMEDTKIITRHLGNRTSITAVDGGRSINTSTDFTPFAGAMMGTCCGDIDPAIATYVMKKTGVAPDETDDVMNMQSGMLGVSGISSDAHGIGDSCKEGNPVILLTVEVYVNRVINVVDGYYAQLGGADAIVFIEGTGENDINMCKMIHDRLSVAFGIQLDEELNGKTKGREALLFTARSKVAIWLIPTNKELVIACDIYRLIA